MFILKRKNEKPVRKQSNLIIPHTILHIVQSNIIGQYYRKTKLLSSNKYSSRPHSQLSSLLGNTKIELCNFPTPSCIGSLTVQNTQC